MRGGVQVGSKCNHCVTEHNLTINGENNRIILRESQEMKKFVFIKENPREKVIGMQTIQQQGPGSKSLLDAWVGIIFLPHVCSILICPDPLPLLMEIQRKKNRGLASKHRLFLASQKGWPVPLPSSSETSGRTSCTGSLVGLPVSCCPKACQSCADSQLARKGVLGESPVKSPIAQWLRQDTGARIPGLGFPLRDTMLCALRQAT